MYDYTAWESRSQDLFSDKPKIVEESTTFSKDGQFTNDLIGENRLSNEFGYSSPFAKASTLVKNNVKKVRRKKYANEAAMRERSF